MVERSHSLNMPEGEATDLRIALYEQKELVHRLQDELDAEREASASSASEALAMILRLQGEKATLSMEASQYKRMVEERISHVEISLLFTEDVIYQKELEIAALEHQVQAYRCRLMSLGYTDLVAIDGKLQERDDVNHTSLFVQTGDRSQTPSPEPVLDMSVPVEKGVIEQSLDSGKSLSHHDLDSFSEQMKKLDEQVKEITDFRDKGKMLKQDPVTVSEQETGGTLGDFASSSNVHDNGIRQHDVPVKTASKQKRVEKKGSKRIRDRNFRREREYQAELKRLSERIERLEMERTSEITDTSGVKREEGTIDYSMKSEAENSRTTEKSPPSRDDPSLHSLQMAMLYFWL